MSNISLPNTFTSGTTILSAAVNSNFTTIYNDYNGNITNANIASGAAIVDTKLAQITTGSKVNLTALIISSQATGDMIYASGASTLTRLAIGTSNQLLSVSGGIPAYQTYSSIFLTPKEYTDVASTVSNSTGNQVNSTSSYTDTDLTLTFTPGKVGLVFVSFSGFAQSASGVVFAAINVGSAQVMETGIPNGGTTNVSMSWQGQLAASAQTIKIQIKGNGSACTLLGGTVTARLRVSYPT